MPDESIKPPAIYDNILAPSLNYIGFRLRIKFDGEYFKQGKVIFNHKTVVNICIAYGIHLWIFKQSADFTLGKSLFGVVKLTKKADFDIYINILDLILDLMHAKVFRYLIVAGLLKT